MGRIFLTFTGDVEAGRFIGGLPAADLELDDGADSEERYAQQIAENTQYVPPVLITRRGIERRIVWGAEEEREVPLAERLAEQLTAGGIYEYRDQAAATSAPGAESAESAESVTTTGGAEGAGTGGEAAGEAE